VDWKASLDGVFLSVGAKQVSMEIGCSSWLEGAFERESV
jgi:hypothetical protein